MTTTPQTGAELAKAFDPQDIESRWYSRWERAGYFAPHGDTTQPAYCIQLPPPNVTGTLHMGHAFQQTLMDALIRYRRMRGHNTNWIVGTDHAGIATQIVVERQLQAEGKKRHDFTREDFIKRVWDWKHESGSTITRQMRRLGDSANWGYADTEGARGGYFTMDEKMSTAVVEVFVRLYEQGLIYRGKRLVSWDPVLGTAVSDLEVISEEEDGTLWEIRYPLVDGSGSVTVATTRPETMLGDVAVAVHPDDERYRHLVGQMLVLPLTDRRIPIIADNYVDKEFGTGCVKITPAHDFNDFAIGQRHSLKQIAVLDLTAKINDNAPAAYRGLDRFEARKRILNDLRTAGLLISEKKHKLNVPRSDRTGVIVEPMLTDQWFVKMDGMAQRGLEAVASGQVRFVPEHWTATYNHWLGNIQDWCISRQLWWGHRIPAWYDADGNIFVARSKAEAEARAGGKALRPDEDVLDTWFSSALVPFSTLGWPDKTADLDTYLPSDVLVTGNDIIFFWVARMIMMTLHFTDKVPFRHVYVNAMVRDADGNKMSKSKGNTLDPLDLIDGIGFDALLGKSLKGLMLETHREKAEKYIRKNFPSGIAAFGVDALRFTFTSLAPLSLTLNFDLNRCEGYRNFCNKLWNATRFVLMNVQGHDTGLDESQPIELSSADRWIVSALQRTEAAVTKGFEEYRFDTVSSAIYQFVWDEYCDWYVELAKVQIATGNAAQQRATRRTLVRVLETVLRLAHPIIPFITEELWQKVAPLAGKTGETVMLAPYPVAQLDKIDEEAEARMQKLKGIVLTIRNLRGELKLSPAARVPLIADTSFDNLGHYIPYIQALAKISEVRLEPIPPDCPTPIVKFEELAMTLAIEVDVAAERARLQKECKKLEEEIERAARKLANPQFADKAPKAVVDAEEARLAAFESQLKLVKAQLGKLT